MHYVFMRNVRIRKYNLGNRQIPDQFFQLLFRIDRNSLRIQVAGKLRWIDSAFYVRNLRRCKRLNLVRRVITKISIEIVEVSAGGAHDNELAAFLW